MWKAQQPQPPLLPIRNEEGCWVSWGPMPQDSGVGPGFQKGPKIQPPAGRGPELTPGPGLGWEGTGRGAGSHFPGQTSEVELGRAGPKVLRAGSYFLFPTV